MNGGQNKHNNCFSKKKKVFSFVFTIGVIYIISTWTIIISLFENKSSTVAVAEEKVHDAPLLSPAVSPAGSVLGCAEIAQLEVIRELAWGMNKYTYLIRLPTGVHAVAKRCRGYQCVRRQLLQKEATFLRELQEQYGDQVTQYFGECEALNLLGSLSGKKNYTEIKKINEYVQKNKLNFSIGYTSVMELGKPLVPTWDMKDRQCFAKYLTETDIDDLRNIARRYANFSNGNDPILMAKIGQYSDDINPQQYMISKGTRERSIIANWNNKWKHKLLALMLKVDMDMYPKQYITSTVTREGLINHVDLDELYHCKSWSKYKRARKCTYEIVLGVNCQVMAELTNIPNLDCSLGASSSRTPLDSNALQYRINPTRAVINCKNNTRVPIEKRWKARWP